MSTSLSPSLTPSLSLSLSFHISLSLSLIIFSISALTPFHSLSLSWFFSLFVPFHMTLLYFRHSLHISLYPYFTLPIALCLLLVHTLSSVYHTVSLVSGSLSRYFTLSSTLFHPLLSVYLTLISRWVFTLSLLLILCSLSLLHSVPVSLSLSRFSLSLSLSCICLYLRVSLFWCSLPLLISLSLLPSLSSALFHSFSLHHFLLSVTLSIFHCISH